MANNIREYSEGYEVQFDEEEGRLSVRAWNQGHHDCTAIDLIDLLEHVKKEMPEVWGKISQPILES